MKFLFQLPVLALLVYLTFLFCSYDLKDGLQTEPVDPRILAHYQESLHTKSSLAKGTVSDGSLENGYMVPFKGDNYRYFDEISYVSDRAFLHEKVLNTALGAYKELNKLHPNRKFVIMECSNKNGGKIYPHRTHQNGLSIDFMSPLIKDGKPYYDLDILGGRHYLLDFDAQGRYLKDLSVKIDFEMMAQHIWQLHQQGKKNGVKIKKVILNTNLKDDLFATATGKILKNSGIYFVQALRPLINSLHDDHYHIDFTLN